MSERILSVARRRNADLSFPHSLFTSSLWKPYLLVIYAIRTVCTFAPAGMTLLCFLTVILICNSLQRPCFLYWHMCFN
ncbi:hypothetical protein BKA93DRAFT_23144 [Sparassis latifolia]